MLLPPCGAEERRVDIEVNSRFYVYLNPALLVLVQQLDALSFEPILDASTVSEVSLHGSYAQPPAWNRQLPSFCDGLSPSSGKHGSETSSL